MDTRIPHFDGQKDFLAFLRFLDNREEYERYMTILDERIIKFTEAVTSYGKTKDIERLHHDAELLVVRAESAFTKREETLVSGEAAFKQSMAEKTKALAEKESVMQQRLNERDKGLLARQATLQEREHAINTREADADRKTSAAGEAGQAAQDAKREADEMVARLKAAMPNG